MNVVCKTHIHPNDPCDMIRQPNEVSGGKRIAVWRCPYPGCGNVRKQGLRGKVKEHHEASPVPHSEFNPATGVLPHV